MLAAGTWRACGGGGALALSLHLRCRPKQAKPLGETGEMIRARPAMARSDRRVGSMALLPEAATGGQCELKHLTPCVRSTRFRATRGVGGRLGCLNEDMTEEELPLERTSDPTSAPTSGQRLLVLGIAISPAAASGTTAVCPCTPAEEKTETRCYLKRLPVRMPQSQRPVWEQRSNSYTPLYSGRFFWPCAPRNARASTAKRDGAGAGRTNGTLQVSTTI